METDRDRKLVVAVGHVPAHGSDGARLSELMVACAMGKLAVVKRLVAGGANPNCVNVFGETPLTYAVAAGRQSVVRYLLAKQADVELPHRPGWSPLMYAAATGNHRILAILIQHGADVSRQDHAGRAAVAIARDAGHFRCVATLDLRTLLAEAHRPPWHAKPHPKRKARADVFAVSARRSRLRDIGTV